MIFFVVHVHAGDFTFWNMRTTITPYALFTRLYLFFLFCFGCFFLTKVRLFGVEFSEYNFRKGLIPHAEDQCMINESIQRLSRWISNAFQLYFRTLPDILFNLNLGFQKTMPLVVSRATAIDLAPRSQPRYWTKSFEVSLARVY